MLIVSILLGLGMLSALASWLLRRRLFRIVNVLLALLAVMLLLTGGYGYWYYHRPLPAAVRQSPFRGVTYLREVRESPRRLIVHVVTIDLEQPGIRFLVTPGEPTGEHQLPARTTSRFLDEFKVQVAINGSFFYPWHANGPFDYYPHAGDPVSVQGLAISEGKPYSDARPGHHNLFIPRDNRATIGKPAGNPWNAISGREIIVQDGRVIDALQPDTSPFEPHPRTAVGLDASGKRLLLLVIDGRQPNFSEGATLPELARIAQEHGGHTVLNLDGGGSSTLAIEGANGKPTVLNSPIHGGIPPGVERPVANHLGVFADVD